LHGDGAPFFKHLTQGLLLRPSEYFPRQCFLGASFLPDHEAVDRHRIGVAELLSGVAARIGRPLADVVAAAG
jgi:hypothetical protein